MSRESKRAERMAAESGTAFAPPPHEHELALVEAQAQIEASFDTLTIGGSDTQPFVVGGFFDGLLTRLLASVKFDWHKMDAKELKAAINAMGDGAISCVQHVGSAVKPAVDVFGGVDDIAIDKITDLEVAGIKALVALAIAQVDALFPSDGPFMASPPMTQQDVNDWMNGLTNEEKAMGLPVTMHNAACVEKIMAKPEVIKIIKRLPKKRQLRALTDLTFLEKIMAFFEKFGPILSQILSVLLLFI